MRGTQSGEQGLALVSVLWALSILSLIAAAVITSSSLSYRIERNAWRQIEAHVLADAVLNRAVLALIDMRADKRWRVDGIPQDFEFDGYRGQVRIQDELGKIDLNTANDELVRGLFRSVAATTDEADIMLEEFLSWRAPAGSMPVKVLGEEHGRRGELSYRLRRGAFQSLGELKLVPGLKPDLLAKIEPAVTIYSRRSTIDPQAASLGALLALPGMDKQKAAEVVAERGRGAVLTSGKLEIPPGVLDPSIPLGGRAFSIRIDVRYGERSYSEGAVVRLTNDANAPYWLLARDDF